MKIELSQTGDPRVPIENDREMRAIALRFAIETKPFTFDRDETSEDLANRLVDMARIFEEYIDQG